MKPLSRDFVRTQFAEPLAQFFVLRTVREQYEFMSFKFDKRGLETPSTLVAANLIALDATAELYAGCCNA